MEIWKDVKGYEGFYQVSNKGRVRSLERYIVDKNGHKRFVKERFLKPYERDYKKGNMQNRRYVALSKNGKNKNALLYRLMAEAFIPNPNNLPTVNHKDGNPLNDVLENLEWMSNEDNIKHAFNNGLMKFMRPVIKIDPDTLEELEEYPSETAACRAHGMRDDKIRRAIKRNGTSAGYKWKYKDVSMKEGD